MRHRCFTCVDPRSLPMRATRLTLQRFDSRPHSESTPGCVDTRTGREMAVAEDPPRQHGRRGQRTRPRLPPRTTAHRSQRKPYRRGTGPLILSACARLGRLAENDPNAAPSIAIAACRAEDLRTVCADDHARVLKLLSKRHRFPDHPREEDQRGHRRLRGGRRNGPTTTRDRTQTRC